VLPQTNFYVLCLRVFLQNHQDMLIRSDEQAASIPQTGALQPLLTRRSDDLKILSNATRLDPGNLQVPYQGEFVEVAQIQRTVSAQLNVFLGELIDV
jgi:hypothetical protein